MTVCLFILVDDKPSTESKSPASVPKHNGDDAKSGGDMAKTSSATDGQDYSGGTLAGCHESFITIQQLVCNKTFDLLSSCGHFIYYLG